MNLSRVVTPNIMANVEVERSPGKCPQVQKLLDALRSHGVEVLDDGLRLVPKGKRSRPSVRCVWAPRFALRTVGGNPPRDIQNELAA